MKINDFPCQLISEFVKNIKKALPPERIELSTFSLQD